MSADYGPGCPGNVAVYRSGDRACVLSHGRARARVGLPPGGAALWGLDDKARYAAEQKDR